MAHPENDLPDDGQDCDGEKHCERVIHNQTVIPKCSVANSQLKS